MIDAMRLWRVRKTRDLLRGNLVSTPYAVQ